MLVRSLISVQKHYPAAREVDCVVFILFAANVECGLWTTRTVEHVAGPLPHYLLSSLSDASVVESDARLKIHGCKVAKCYRHLPFATRLWVR